jgi:hypothetical protein
MNPRHAFQTVFRFSLVLLLSFSTVLTPVARAAGEAREIVPADVTPARYHEALKSLRVGSSDWVHRVQTLQDSSRDEFQKSFERTVAKKMARGALHGVEEAGRTVVLIMILTGVELVAQEVHRSNLEGKPIDTKRLEKMSLDAAEHLLTGGQLISSMATAGLTSALAKKPIQILTSILQNATSRKILVGLVQSGITSFITFTGWEAGSELWSQATLLIPDDKDFDRAKNLIRVLAGAAHGNSDDRRVLSLLIDKMGQILLYDDDLRTAWLYNTWRLHVATGQFVVLVSSMVTTAALGTALFPGAGTVAGMMFGVVGGLISSAVPESVKETISDGFRGVRSSSNQAQLAADRAQIAAWIEEGRTATPEDFRGILKMQAKGRFHVMTAYSEADYKRRVSIQAMEHEMETARESLEQLDVGSRDVASLYSNDENLDKKLRQVIASDSKKIEKFKNEIQRIEQAMWHFYVQETQGLVALMNTASRVGPKASMMVEMLKPEINRLSVIAQSFTIMVTEGVDLKNSDVLSLIQVSNFRGFKEDRLLKALKTASQDS